MKICTSYKVKLKGNNRVFRDTADIYNRALAFFVRVCLLEWERFSECTGIHQAVRLCEELTNPTAQRPRVKYDFSRSFYKFPCYLRRAAIAAAYGKVCSYQSSLQNWQEGISGKEPSLPHAGHDFPAMYKGNMFRMAGTYRASVKVWVRNTWDWITVELRKSDIDYIRHHCGDRKELCPVLRRRRRSWYLDFCYEEEVALPKSRNIFETRVLAVDLGMNTAATAAVMQADGTVLGREFLSLPGEYDCLWTAVGRLKGMQQRGNRRCPGQWAAIKGLNRAISVKTAAWIVEKAVEYKCDVIVFEHLGLRGKRRGNKKQRLHMWRAQYVQAMVADKAHRKGLRISRINAWGTSRLAFDGSGRVERRNRGTQDRILRQSYSLCRFSTGKYYNCDLNAAYNIGARYYIREILKSQPETEGLALQAKVPAAARRSQCTLSTLISLSAALYGSKAM